MSPLHPSLFCLPHHTAKRALVLLLCVLGIGYALFQGRQLLLGPQLTLTEKPDILQTERLVVLSGTAANISAIAVNGRPVVTDQAGHFSIPVVLSNGYNVVTLSARDRYGREVRHSLPFVYQSTTTAQLSLREARK